MKNSDSVKINSVNPLYIITNEVDGSIEEKMKTNTLLLLLLIKTKRYWKSIQNFGMKLNIILKQ